MKYFIWAIIIWILYRIIVNFIIPIFRVTSAAKSQMRQMQEQMNAMNDKMNDQPKQPQQQQRTVQKEGDYIDYEEVK